MSKYLVQVGEIRAGKEGSPGASKVLRHVAAKDGFPKPDVATLYEMFDKSAKQYGSNKCLGYRPITDGKPGDYQWYTYAEVAAKVKDIASGMASIGIEAGQRVGVYGANCCEWMMVMQVGQSLPMQQHSHPSQR
jgi:long-chain acyl-CoA synthetase